jgi:plasmid stabilization system protein ParE
MLRLHYSQRSRADLDEIWDYVAHGSPRNAEAVLDRIHMKIDLLRLHPRAGHRRDDVRPGVRCAKSDGYLIFHRVTDGTLHVDRIVHHSRHLGRLRFDES